MAKYKIIIKGDVVSEEVRTSSIKANERIMEIEGENLTVELIEE